MADNKQLRAGGTNGLFARVENIADKLRNCADVHATLTYIDSEGEKLHLSEHNDHAGSKSLYGNQVSYLHNEFNLDAARAIQGLALITHVSFIPIYPPKPEEPSGPYATIEAKTVAKPIVANLQALRNLAIQRLSRTMPGKKFYGGRDTITMNFVRFLSYDQPVITTLGEIERMAAGLREDGMKSSDSVVGAGVRRADDWNQAISDEVKRSGSSSRLSMLREYMIRISADQVSQTRLTWVRHHEHYQTLTAIEQTSPARIGEPAPHDDAAIAPTLFEIARNLRAGVTAPLLNLTAFQSLPGKWADHLFGRYLQGANYLILPADWLLADSHVALCDEQPETPGVKEPGWRVLWDQAIAHCSIRKPAYDATTFRALWFAARGDDIAQRLVADLALRLLRPLVAQLFPDPGGGRFEFVMFGAVSGAALILSDVRNIGMDDRGRRTSARIVVDFAMNDFERGRLMKTMTDFSTRRYLTLGSLATFRFVNDVLDVLSADLAAAVNEWTTTSVNAEGDEEEDEPINQRDKLFIDKLQALTINLTTLNNLVDCGISAHASNVDRSQQRVRTLVRAMGHYPLPGFMSLTDFLDRRFYDCVSMINAAASRYTLLRQRVAELSALAEAKVETNQNKNQIKLLSKVDRLTLFGLVYYAGQIAAYAVAFVLFIYLWSEHGWSGDKHSYEAIEHRFELAKLWFYVIGIVLAFWIAFSVFKELGKEFRESPLTRLIGRFVAKRWATLTCFYSDHPHAIIRGSAVALAIAGIAFLLW